MRYRRTLRYEPLENRRLLATLTVTTLADTIDLSDGLTSLREAIFATNLVAGPDIIEFSSKLPGIVTLTHGELRITDDLTIRHQGGLITLDALTSDPTPAMNNGDGSRIFHVDDGSSTSFIEVVIEGLALVGGDAPLVGGAILNRENLTLSRMQVIGNSASSGDITILSNGGGIAHSLGRLVVTDSEIAKNVADFGGGIHVESGSLVINRSIIAMNSSVSGSGIYIAAGEAAVANSWITGNSAGAFSLGGGIYNSGNLRVDATTISGNTASFGAGIFNRTDAGEVTLISHSTISGNTAFDRGGGVRNAAGLTVIFHSTITGNQAPPGDGGGVASRGYDNSQTEIHSTIIAGNMHGDVDFGTGDLNTFVSLGYNLIGSGNATAEFDAAGDRAGIADPLLGPLADNGGPTLPDGSNLLAHALLPGSPAINAGDLNAKAGTGGVPQFDQRGEGFPRVANGRIDIGAYEFEEPSDLNLIVDTLADESDGNFSIGDLSLREAIELANQWPSTDTIRFDPDLTAAAPATILLTQGELKITDDVLIDGPGAELLFVDAQQLSRIFNIDDGLANQFHVTIAGLTLTHGRTTGHGGREGTQFNTAPNGGAIRSVTDGMLTIQHCVISNSSTLGQYAHGGGIFASGGLSISETVVSGNDTAGFSAYGGGVSTLFRTDAPPVMITNSAIRDNHTEGGFVSIGGGIFVAGQLTLNNSSVTGNSTVGRAADGGGISARTLLMQTGSVVSENHTEGDYAGGGGISARDATITGSTVSENYTAGKSATGGGVWTSGTLLVSGSNIANNRTTGESAMGGGVHSRFRLTIEDSFVTGNSTAGVGAHGGVVVFDGLALPGRIPTVLRSVVSSNRTTGASAHGGGVALLAGAQFAQFDVTQSTVAANSTAGAGSRGGGVYSIDRVMVNNSTVNSNTASGDGGGTSSRRLFLFSSTFSGNSSDNNGGGAHVLLDASVNNSTVTLNHSDRAGGGIYLQGGPLNLNHSIVALNTAPAGRDITGLLGTVIDAHYSLLGSNSQTGLLEVPVGSPDANGNLIGGSFSARFINPLLSTLANFGGSTMTHALLQNSPAIDSGDPAAMEGVGGAPLHDQRNQPFARVFGAQIDIGAFEAQPNPLVGDYNIDAAVDAADYALWRNTHGSTIDLRADGNGDGMVNDADRLVWRTNFGRTAEIVGQGAASVEFESNAIAPKRPASPAGEFGAASAPWADSSFTTARRRAVGSRLVETISLNSAARSEDSVLAALLLLQRTSDVEWPDFSPRSDNSRGLESEVSDARASLLDCVFDTIGDC